MESINHKRENRCGRSVKKTLWDEQYQKRMDDNMNIEKLKKYLDSDDIRKEFIEGLLKIISSNVESVWPSELRDYLSAWAETAEICLDNEIMYNIKQAENEIKAGIRY